MKVSFFSIDWGVFVIVVVLVIVVAACTSKRSSKNSKFEGYNTKVGEFIPQKFKASKGKLNYQILYPKGFDETKKYPLLLFLHGAGERGKDNKAQLIHGGDLIQKEMNRLNGIAILPQCSKDEYWINVKEVDDRPDGTRNIEPDTDKISTSLKKVIQLMEAFTEQTYVDKSRIYVAGLSMGGMGTFDLCWRMPTMFAAASAICGAGSEEKAKEFSSLPIRIYHGEEDQVVLVEESKEMIQALRDAGGEPEVYLYPDVNHSSWDNAFAEDDFISWMFEKVRI
ncbi:MAG: prolyl oligopeptidase family serine peptidase [Saprospiraceae bacterium]|nr:prolyl oligopeptidase family serine peptidase [Saprospiraceae bacterium]